VTYRTRCYNAFVSKHWIYSHALSREEYDFLEKIYVKKFTTFLPSDKNSAIIDVACGAGHFLYFLKKNKYENIIGIDLSKEQIDCANIMGLTEVEVADLFEYLPKHQDKYDMIIANDIIEHLTKEETLTFLDTLYAALKPGGTVLIGTVNAASLFGAATVYVDFTHEQGFTPISLSQVLRICSYENVQIHGDGPVPHDIRSFLRAWLWKITKVLLRVYLRVETGTGRDLWKQNIVLEPRIFAVAKKPVKK
jgi:2-polyprenyl-3-methyl-5-hydroxy-6-metoxy-1,4-benzoquinol methylase